MALRVYHRLFTHVPDAPGLTGGRIVGLGENDVGAHAPKHVTETIDEILWSLVPVGTDPAFAVRRFPGQGESFACLAVSYPNVVTDGVGRPGALAHARLIRVPADRAWLDIHALLDCAWEVSLARVEEEQRVMAYVDQLEEWTEVAPWHSTVLQNIEFNLLWEVMSVLMAASARPRLRASLACDRGRDAAHVVASAWCTLPLALQISSSWTCDAKEGGPSAILFGRGAEVRNDVPMDVRELARDYLELLIDASLDIGVIHRHGGIQSLDQLRAAVGDLQGAAMIGSPPVEGVNRKEERTVRNKEVEPPQVQASSIAVAEMLRQQLAVLDERLRKYIDDRIKLHDGARQYTDDDTSPPSSIARMTTTASVPSPRILFGGVIAAAALVVALLIGGGVTFLFLSRKMSALERRLAQIEVAGTSRPIPDMDAPLPPVAVPQRFDLETIPEARWRNRLRWVMENRQDLLTPLAEEIDGSALVDGGARDELRILMQRSINGTLNQSDRLRFRALLFEYLVARDLALGNVRVDGEPDEISPVALQGIKRQLDVESDPSTLDDFMAEAILRRAAR